MTKISLRFVPSSNLLGHQRVSMNIHLFIYLFTFVIKQVHTGKKVNLSLLKLGMNVTGAKSSCYRRVRRTRWGAWGIQPRIQGVSVALWQGVQPGLRRNRNQDWKASGNQIRSLPPLSYLWSFRWICLNLSLQTSVLGFSTHTAEDNHFMFSTSS